MTEPSWRDRALAWRDRLLASQHFQRWAASFPLTRGIAKRRAGDLFDLCAGFVYSQILLAAVQLRLFEILESGPLTVAALAGRTGLPVEGMWRLLEAAAALRLIERRGQDRSGHDRYGLGVLGAALLGNPAVTAMILHHPLLYADLADPVALLKRGATGPDHETALARYWAYARAERPAGLGQADIAAYSTLMSASQPLVAGDVLDAYPLHRHRCLLDVGGGEGTFLTEAALRAPGLRLMLFDLPPVVERARAKLAAAGLAGRAKAVGGSFLADPLPEGADIVSLIRVVHDHDDAAVLTLLGAVRRVLPADGVLLLAEPMAGTAGAGPVGAYFGFYLLAMGSGRPRSLAELEALLHQAGFGSVEPIRTRRPMLTRLIAARPARSPGNS